MFRIIEFLDDERMYCHFETRDIEKARTKLHNIYSSCTLMPFVSCALMDDSIIFDYDTKDVRIKIIDDKEEKDMTKEKLEDLRLIKKGR